ncbi:MAG TPA: zinc ribbon domain-containing protein [Candidatus Scybalomonas excrementigallinarum]|nr:zinc ribbon domain-containing protein [Candidatus Scybalomonas excrementigallinarum]
MFCPKCGKEIKDDSVFCVYCGSKVNNITNTAETKEENEEILCSQIKEECIQENIIKKNSKKKVLLGGGIASVAVIACVGGAVFMTSFSGNSEKGAPVAESSDITNTSKEREAKAITQETEEQKR